MKKLLSVFIMVFVLFIPMHVDAATLSNSGVCLGATPSISNVVRDEFSQVNLLDSPVSGTVYAVDIDISYTINFAESVYVRNFVLSYGDIPLFSQQSGEGTSLDTTQTYTRSLTFYVDGSLINGKSFNTSMRYVGGSGNIFDYNSTLVYTINSIDALNGADSSSYHDGYNAGFSAGQSDGYNSGYSDGYSTGKDDGFQEGVDSVDTQSFYDAGYNAGYSVAYDIAYDEGYSNGWQSAMERIESWGADTTDYPVLVYESESLSGEGFISLYDVAANTSATVTKLLGYYYLDFEPNPDHTYKVSFDLPLNSGGYGGSSYSYSGKVYHINFSGMDLYGDNSIFITGNRMNDKIVSMVTVNNLTNNLNEVSLSYESVPVGYSFTYTIYDYGPTNGTQNHIANQTDQMMNTPTDNNDKYNSDLDGFNSELDSGISSEENIMTEQNENINNFEYKPIGEFSGLTSAMSFYSAVVTSAFSSLADFQALWVISLTIIVIMVLLRISRGE